MSAASPRVELQLARARASLLAAHAHITQDIVTRLGGRLPTARLVELYCRALDLPEFEERWLRIQAIAHAGVGAGDREDEPRRRTAVRRAWHDLVDEIRFAIAPHGDAELQEHLTYELAAARAIVLKVHVRNAVALADATAAKLSAPAAVALYIRELGVGEEFGATVYALALTQLRSAHQTPLLAAHHAARTGE